MLPDVISTVPENFVLVYTNELNIQKSNFFI